MRMVNRRRSSAFGTAIASADGRTSEWTSASLRAYQRRTRAADAVIAGAYLSGTNTRRVRRALAAVFAGPVGKDVVSRAWRRVKGDWDAWNARPLGEEPIVRISSTFWPSARTPSASRSEIDVARLSRRTRTTVPDQPP